MGTTPTAVGVLARQKIDDQAFSASPRSSGPARCSIRNSGKGGLSLRHYGFLVLFMLFFQSAFTRPLKKEEMKWKQVFVR